MVYLLLAILTSAMIAVIMRLSTDRVSGRTGMLAVNYFACLVLAALHTGVSRLIPADPGVPAAMGLGFVNGFLFLAGFVLLQINTERNGVVLSSIFMKLGLLVPMVISVLFFREIPTAVQIVGFCAAIVAIVLINYEKGGKAGSSWSLLLLLLAGGSCDAMAKIFEEIGPASLSAQFLFYTFVVSLVLCLILALRKKEHFGKKELLFGLLLGVPNFYSARFLLASMKMVPAVIAYPTFSVGTILTVTLSGVIFFREKLKTRQWVALAIILAALVLLNL